MSEEPELMSLDEIFASDTDGLLDEPEKAQVLTGEDRLRRSFAEINAFVSAQGREPDATVREIGERRLGARLYGIRVDAQKVAALTEVDTHGLLVQESAADLSLDDILGLDDDLLKDETGILDTSGLPPRIQRSDPDWVAKREKAADFAQFAPLFAQKQLELRDGTAVLVPGPVEKHIREGRFFVLGGQMLFIAKVGETEKVAGRLKERLRVVFENGTESAMYRQSLTSRLHEDDSFLVAQSIVEISGLEPGDEQTGHIYVLKSLSDHPEVLARPNLHKIGFTRAEVAARIAGAEKSTTYLMAPVKVIADYRTYNLRASVLEHLLHTLFASVRVPFAQVGFSGQSAEASEWFDVPLDAIDQAISLVSDGSLLGWAYSAQAGRLVPRSAG